MLQWFSKFAQDVREDTELFAHTMHGYEVTVVSWPKRVYHKIVAAIGGLRAGWASVSAPKPPKKPLLLANPITVSVAPLLPSPA